ncbi:tRNA1(Val) A37 N6-methylase TrmN6 [Aliiruegeria haliotis]|uniref:tRNA1(Val) A37 N6-methylase TrmN6 n=1 Tax=Aliiruegeria haliotis TaxID=1280846 RepID=A0A2T0RT21_9RHOB|nr:methyltransferase [Aliiruegeria haliotis]PRY24292.1 tRNA1(Val) A37 N6-methylase TrmN6 [Aliiruegeria haliotis]
MDEALTRDDYLGGRLSLWQPARGYRAGIDPVLLAAACPAKAGESILELGCGVGTAALCLSVRVPDLRITGVERQADMAALACRNASETGAHFQVVTADIATLPDAVKQQSYDHVIANPPFFLRSESHASPHPAREAAMGEDTALATWMDVAARRLKPKGWLTLIHRTERLADLLCDLGTLGSVQIQPLQPRPGREANLILLRARKNGRAPLRLHPPVTLHTGEKHVTDGEDYSPAIRAVLRSSAPFPGF